MPYSNISLNVSQFTNNDIELYPLYRILVIGLGMYLSTHKAFKHYSLNNGKSMCVSIHIQSSQSLSSLSNNVRSKCVSIHTQSYQSLSSLLYNGKSKYEFFDTQSYKTLFFLPRNSISNCP